MGVNFLTISALISDNKYYITICQIKHNYSPYKVELSHGHGLFFKSSQLESLIQIDITQQNLIYHRILVTDTRQWAFHKFLPSNAFPFRRQRLLHIPTSSYAGMLSSWLFSSYVLIGNLVKLTVKYQLSKSLALFQNDKDRINKYHEHLSQEIDQFHYQMQN